MFLIRKIFFGIIGGVVVLLFLAYFIFLPLFSWIPDGVVPEGFEDANKVIVVDRDKQVFYAYEKGEQKFKFLVVTGRTGNPTPLGEFKVAWKSADYHSREYDAPMPWSMFFVASRGIAIHGSTAIPYRWRYNDLSPGMPAGSGGCVSLTKRNAKKVFEWADISTPVVVLGTDEVADEG
ncbi:MAG: L,D-transpeptidase [Verrucomicrobiota bacterium]